MILISILCYMNKKVGMHYIIQCYSIMQSVPFPSTQTDTYTAYVRSGCAYCSNLMEMFKKNNSLTIIINCDPYIRRNKSKFLEEMNSRIDGTWTTFPMVFYNGEFIGGFTETVQYLQ